MALVAKAGGGERKPFESPQPDQYPAVCTKVIDLGTHLTEFKDEKTGEQKLQHQIAVFWELDEKMSDGRPFQVNTFYTLSLNEKSKLYKDLVAWRGKDFTPEELRGFELANMLGKGCLINIILKNDKAVVGGVSKLAKGMSAPKPEGELILFDISEWNQDTFNKLTEYWQEKIKSSNEYHERLNAGNSAAQEAANDIEESDLPF